MDGGNGTYHDRKAGLIFFGIVEMFIAVVLLLMAAMIMVMSSTISQNALQNAAVDPGALRIGCGMYLVLAVCFGTLGIGSVLARRWARALVLIAAWWWLVVGIMAMAMMVMLGPRIFAGADATTHPMPEQFKAVLWWFMLAFMAFVYVVVPGALVLFYRSRHVKATCEDRDPKPRWTDACPLPVLGLALMMLCSGVMYMPCMAYYKFTVPCGTRLVSGYEGLTFCALMSVFFLVISYGLYHLEVSAWWATLGVFAFLMVSFSYAFASMGLLEVYEKMGMPPEQIELIRQMGILDDPSIYAITGACTVVFLIYLVWLHKWFTGNKAAAR